MIGSSKNSRENYPRKYFWTREKETRVKFNPGLSANRLSNNWALEHISLRILNKFPTHFKSISCKSFLFPFYDKSNPSKRSYKFGRIKITGRQENFASICSKSWKSVIWTQSFSNCKKVREPSYPLMMLLGDTRKLKMSMKRMQREQRMLLLQCFMIITK